MRRQAWRSLLTLGLAALALAPVLLVAAAVETRPLVGANGPADAAAAMRTRAVVADLQALAAAEADRGVWTVDEVTLNGALAAAGRMLPGLAARSEVAGREVMLALSLPAPLLPGDGWLNFSGALAASEDGLEVTAARLGRIELPPAMVLPALRLGLDAVLGDGLGSAALDGVTAVRVDPPSVSVALDMAEVDRRALGRRVRAALTGPSGAQERVHVHLWWLHRAGREAELPDEGSALPWLRYAVERAHALAAPGEEQEEMRAALFALAIYCGDPRFGRVVGVDLSDRMRGRRNGCRDARLAGRTDLRQHFVVSAGLKAATSASTALGIGELKELLDSAPGGSGFSFDDMAANLAGARFAAELMARPPAEWPALAARMTGEGDVMPPIDGLPAGLGEAAFVERFGDVESAAYRRVIAEIEARIDRLPLHAAVLN